MSRSDIGTAGSPVSETGVTARNARCAGRIRSTMIIEMRADAPRSTTGAVMKAAADRRLVANELTNERGGAVVGVDGNIPLDHLDLPGIVRVDAVHKPYMLTSREMRGPSTVMVREVPIGNGTPITMAGPCVIEDRDSLIEIALEVWAAGARLLRGGAYKPRTSPYSFQGLGEEGLRYLAEARQITGMPVVTEVMEPDQVDLVAEYADMLQIGSRNMANFPLLRKVGRSGKPVLLKRGFSATLEEFLMSAEYVLAHGNADVVLCERGIRGFDSAFRFNLDLNIVPALRELTHLPIVVDPSHGTGRRELVPRMAMAGIAAGADGLMLEVHPEPDSALCDGPQTITPETLARIQHGVSALSCALDPIFAPAPEPLSIGAAAD
jgi:3-deoxy-7-phosphoheptulonate synthase